MTEALTLEAVPGIGEIEPGDDLGRVIGDAIVDCGASLGDDDVVCVAQKIVSKAEGRMRRLADVSPGERARELARDLDRDPRLVELVLAQSRRVVRAERVLIVETHGGWICANAGIDSSNVPGDDAVTLLPVDADASARAIRAGIASATRRRPAVLISDSFGRPWRVGQTDVAIGCAGLGAVDDWRGRPDADGRDLAATVIAVADALAAASDLARAKDAREPVVLVRGAGRWRTDADGPGAVTLQRAGDEDLFR